MKYIIAWANKDTPQALRAKSLAHLQRLLSRQKDMDIVLTPRGWGWQMYQNHTETWLGDVSLSS